MKDIKVLVAGITNPILSNKIKEQFEQNDCKVNIIGELIWLHLFILRTLKDSKIKYQYEYKVI